jgi:hypothetical protein
VPYNKESPLVQNYIVDLLRAAQAGYAVVVQDCRGCFASEGEFTPLVQEGPDGADTIAWAASQPFLCNQFNHRCLQEVMGAPDAQVGLCFVRHFSLRVAYVTKDQH